MSGIIGPIRATTLSFAKRTFGETSNVFYMKANVTDEGAIATIREAAASVCKDKGVTYALIDNPPVQGATESGEDLVDGGVVLHCRYRLDATHLTPFTEDGKDFIDSLRNDDFENLMTVGREAKLALRFNATAPTAEAVTIDGNVVRRARPNGAVYCDLVALRPLKGVVEFGNVLSRVSFELEDGEEACETPAPTIYPNEQAAENTTGVYKNEDDIPF